MSNLTEVLFGLQEVTNKNLEILKAINDSFHSKRDHVVALIDGQRYVIPSYLYLESKIGDLENNFENLVNAPKTGTAAFVFDGNTQEIQMKSFTNTPDGVSLKEVTNFMVDENHIFKDMLNPNPYIRMDISSVGPDIVEVVVKKVAIKNQELLSRVMSERIDDTTNIEWKKLAKILYGYTADKDYVEYDTIRRIPVREGNPTGTYTVNKILKEWIDSDLVEHYTIELNESLNYYIESETIQKEISVGDKLVTSNGIVKLTIIDLDYQNKTIEVTVDNGAFSDIVEYNPANENNRYATLKYFSTNGQDKNRFVDVPLEEDKNVAIFIAPLDSRLNIQAPWGIGIIIDTDNITIEEETENGTIVYKFTDYYRMKINNIGDTLYGLTKMFSTDLFNMTTTELDDLKNTRPVINEEILQVVEINSHLNDSESVKKIRSLHNQKSIYKSDLETVQGDIDHVVGILSEMSFADTSENRTVYEEQLNNLNARKIELSKNISEIVDEISDNVNSADVPIENAKYHIRGFYDVSEIENLTGKKVVKIDVEYRYKNRNTNSGTALSMSTSANGVTTNYIYSDWNKMPSYTINKIPRSESDTIVVEYPERTQDINVPSFNQIDIPITQGETVDIRLRVQFSDGWPFISTMSSWSPIVNIGFPEEFVANLPIMRIIDENNEDAENYRFKNILVDDGVTEHVNNGIMDQDVKFFHRPENISSGFYTPERRIIPLKDKLESMDNDIRTIIDEMYGFDPAVLDVSASDQSYTVTIKPNTNTTFIAPAYNTTENNRDGELTQNAVDIINICISNPTDHNIKLFTMFPGNTNTPLTTSTRSRFNPEDYTDISSHTDISSKLSIWGYSDNIDKFNWLFDNISTHLFTQHQNQLLYFRLRSPYDNTEYYGKDADYQDILDENNILCGTYAANHIRKNGYDQDPEDPEQGNGATLCMNISDISSISTDGVNKFVVLEPGASITVPLEFRYKLGQNITESISKTVSFDIWTSLFGDPSNYTLTIKANSIDDISSRNRTQSGQSRYTPIVVR